MAVLDQTELARLDLQQELDAATTTTSRNKMGQFATPTALACDILSFAKTMMPEGELVRFLDPAIGTGSFYAALLSTFPASRIASAVGYEVDPHYGLPAQYLWAHEPLDYRLADFTSAPLPESDDAKSTLLICNPPYVRHHHLSGDDKVRLQRLSERVAGVRISGLAGLYCHFLCISHAWMADGGLAGWLIPSEFMDVNYGEQVKRYLLERVTLHRIHRFDPNDVQFADALVSSAVVWFTKALPPEGHAVEFTYGGTLSAPEVSATIPAKDLRHVPKWTKFPLASEAGVTTNGHARIGDLFDIRRGLATGNNDYFVLTAEEAAGHDLPSEFLIPILPSPRYLKVDEVEADEHGIPELDRKLFLLDCSLPEAEVEARYPSLWRYYQKGIEAGIADTYLCAHRKPWYAQEKRPAAPVICTYMGRQGTKSGRPFRFILNHSRATAANVYLMLYPKPPLKGLLQESAEVRRAVWNALRDIPAEQLLGVGRVYGGGLHKLEPKELANGPADSVLNVLADLLEDPLDHPLKSNSQLPLM